MSDVVQFEKRGRIGVIAVDNPPVNALGQAVRQGLIDALAKALADAEVQAIVLIGKGRTFVAGADISEFGKPHKAPSFTDGDRALRRQPEARSSPPSTARRSAAASSSRSAATTASR